MSELFDFNSRFIKFIFPTLLIGATFFANANGQNQSLTGAAAIRHLRETGGLDLLRAAFDQARSGGAMLRPTAAPVKITAADGEAYDWFGNDVAISGDTAIVAAQFDRVGANADQGSAYVFVRSGGMWIQQAQLIDADGAVGDVFGASVAISGDTAIVGAGNDDIGANAEQGSVCVFVRNGTTWTQQAKLTAADGAAGATFGRSVAISGDTAVVGAYLDDVGTNANQGSAYVFARTGAAWTQQAKLIAADGAINDFFGRSVGISGDTIIVGTISDDIGANPNQGSAYIFIRNGIMWTQQAKLTAADGAANDQFSCSVDINSDTAIVGVFADTVGTNIAQGSAYIFTRNGATWTQQAKLTATDGAAHDFFGDSVAISGETAIVGARSDDIGMNTDQGSAYIFRRSGTTWTQQTKLTAADGATSDNFSWSVGISGNSTIVGAFFDDIGANEDQGSAYIFDLNSRRTAFDFDGDGRADVAVFRPSNGVWYLQQSTAGFNGISFGQSGDRIAPADYDGDGKADVAVFRPSNGTWYLQRSSFGFTGIIFGDGNDIPMPADYDGDGKADVAVFRPSNGVWYIQQSTAGFIGAAFGANGDIPVAADYDGDGKADIAVFRPSNGVWYLQRSQLGFSGIAFGVSGDKPVVSDYDGDGKADIAVFRPSNGVWYLQQSTAGFTGIAFGATGDLPVAADYDGDGKADIAVFRGGTWYLQRSTQGFTGVAFGAASDKPIPNAFVP